MTNPESQLQQFAEAFLDVDRLKIIGALAKGARKIIPLAKQTGLSPDDLRAHLAVLSETGVVIPREGEDEAYDIHPQALEEMSKQQFRRARELQRRGEPDRRPIGDAFSKEEAKYIRSFTDRDGIIKHLPSLSKKAKLLAVLKYAMQDLESGRTYSEAGFNQALARFTRDASSVRRYLVDFGFVERKIDGSAYWLTEAGDD